MITFISDPILVVNTSSQNHWAMSLLETNHNTYFLFLLDFAMGGSPKTNSLKYHLPLGNRICFFFRFLLTDVREPEECAWVYRLIIDSVAQRIKKKNQNQNGSHVMDGAVRRRTIECNYLSHFKTDQNNNFVGWWCRWTCQLHSMEMYCNSNHKNSFYSL